MKNKIQKIQEIETLIKLQSQYLKNLKEECKIRTYNYPSSNSAGFFRISLEVNKQVQMLKRING
jgi:hypothetical protein